MHYIGSQFAVGVPPSKYLHYDSYFPHHMVVNMVILVIYCFLEANRELENANIFMTEYRVRAVY